MCANRAGIRRGGLNVQQALIEVDVKITCRLVADLNFLACIAMTVRQGRQLNGEAGDGGHHMILAHTVRS